MLIFYSIISFLLLLLPIISLFKLLRYLYKDGEPISVLNKIGLGLFFLVFAVGVSFSAAWVFAWSMSSAGEKCVTAAIGMIPIGFVINLIGIPSILILVRRKA